MITIKYTILLSNPRQTFVTRYAIASYRVGNFCKVISLDEDGYDDIGENDKDKEGNIYKFMELYVHGQPIQLHSITNPLTQYRRYGHRSSHIPSYL